MSNVVVLVSSVISWENVFPVFLCHLGRKTSTCVHVQCLLSFINSNNVLYICDVYCILFTCVFSVFTPLLVSVAVLVHLQLKISHEVTRFQTTMIMSEIIYYSRISNFSFLILTLI